ncbi:hypothetical protein T03_14694 [Trichinella britovi]|uniref:Uncharacterized protein n=1 Tax=Trichinella britovi TaxID=45882 RepID=A0A0V1D7Z3_TRIBR|nr:hypothetical protein T03_14694 [Trichinella britovi]
MIAPAWNSILGSTFHVSWKKILGYNEECVNQRISNGLSKTKLSLIVSGILSDNEIFETAEKDENKDVDASDEPNKGLCHSKTHSGLKKQFNATQLVLRTHILDAATDKKLSLFKPKTRVQWNSSYLNADCMNTFWQTDWNIWNVNLKNS